MEIKQRIDINFFLHKNNTSIRQIAGELGVSTQAVYGCLNGSNTSVKIESTLRGFFNMSIDNIRGAWGKI